MEENVIQINGRITMLVLKTSLSEKNYIWNPSKCSCKNGKSLAGIMNDSAIACDEVIESYGKETKTIPTNFNEKKVICKTQKFLYFTCIFVKLLHY